MDQGRKHIILVMVYACRQFLAMILALKNGYLCLNLEVHSLHFKAFWLMLFEQVEFKE